MYELHPLHEHSEIGVRKMLGDGSVKQFLSDGVANIKTALYQDYKNRRFGAPVPASGYHWGVTWPGNPVSRDCIVDKQEVLNSVTKWQSFTLGTRALWLGVCADAS